MADTFPLITLLRGFGTLQTSWHTQLWKNGGLLPER
jgi:hypothetical protein